MALVTVLKYVLIAWNVFVMVMGLAMLGVGIWLSVDDDAGQVLGDSLLKDSPVIINYSSVVDSILLVIMAYCLIGLGVLIIIVTALDTVGAILDKRSILGVAFSILAFILVGLIVGGVFLYVKRDEIDVEQDKLYPLLRKSLQDAVEHYHSDEQSKKFMDRIQEEYQCCGADGGGGDYAPVMRLPCNMLYADTPCLQPYYEAVQEQIGLKPFFEGKITTGVSIIFVVAALLIITMILTLIMICSTGQ